MKQSTIQANGMKKFKGNDEYEISLEQIKSYKKLWRILWLKLKNFKM